jgi:CheY-like chemotaxis protein
LALTAFARAEDSVSALAAGFTKHAKKPIAPNELIAMLQELSRSFGLLP